jgi:hypothetical protein
MVSQFFMPSGPLARRGSAPNSTARKVPKVGGHHTTHRATSDEQRSFSSSAVVKAALSMTILRCRGTPLEACKASSSRSPAMIGRLRIMIPSSSFRRKTVRVPTVLGSRFDLGRFLDTPQPKSPSILSRVTMSG